MTIALKQALIAYDNKEAPIGAVIVHNNKIIAKAHNQIETLNDPTAHAEMIAITQAAEALDSWRLLDTKIYVTLEPCPMCAGAIQLARIPEVIFASLDPKKGACGSLMNILEDKRFNHVCKITSGVMEDESSALLKDFFNTLRTKGEKL